MNLSREAIVTLRAPAQCRVASALPSLQSQSGKTAYHPPPLAFLAGRWHISHSTLPERATQRNACISLRLTDDNRGFISEATHQGEESGTKFVKATQTATDFHNGLASKFQQLGTGMEWEILAWGKEGQLEDWMIDDDSGWIRDSSGEQRADWRNWYVAIHRLEKDGAGNVEVWDRIGQWKPLTDDTIEKIRAALNESGEEGLKRLANKLGPVTMEISD